MAWDNPSQNVKRGLVTVVPIATALTMLGIVGLGNISLMAGVTLGTVLAIGNLYIGVLGFQKKLV